MQLFKVIYHGARNNLKKNFVITLLRDYVITKKLCTLIFNNTCKKR